MTAPAPTGLTAIGGQAWRNKGARALAAVHLVDCLGNGVYFGTFALYLRQVVQLISIQVGVLLGAGSVMGLVASLGVGRATDRVDARAILTGLLAAIGATFAAVRTIHPSLGAYFACLYYAGLRPAEARHLREKHLRLPERGWGSLLLVDSTPDAGRSWTDSGEPNEDRQLRHRAQNETRLVPAAPELVETLRRHLSQFPSGAGGRLFVTRTGRAGIKARKAALTDDLYESPLAKRPYALRHAVVSLWLNAGVPATQVAEWAGHSVNVLLRVCASRPPTQAMPAGQARRMTKGL